MTNRFLLDTNILSALLRAPDGPIAQHLSRVPEEAVLTSIVVASELRFGARRKESPRLTAVVEEMLRRLDVRPFAAPADRIYAEIRAFLESAGEALSANDLLIAAHTISLDCTLVSDDRAFARVPGLRLENWTA